MVLFAWAVALFLYELMLLMGRMELIDGSWGIDTILRTGEVSDWVLLMENDG